MTDQQKKRTGKFLLIAQLPVYLFCVFIFSQVRTAFDDTAEADNLNPTLEEGVNTEIPKPVLSKSMDKLDLIKKARKDSVDLSKSNKSGFGIFNKSPSGADTEGLTLENGDRGTKVTNLQNKLDRFNEELDRKSQAPPKSRVMYGNEYSYQDFKAQSQRKELELQKMEQMSNGINDDGPDSVNQDLLEVNNTMDKMIKMMEMADALERGEPIKTESTDTPGTDKEFIEVQKPSDGFNDNNSEVFHDLNSSRKTASLDNTFKASFFNKQTLINGSTVKIKLDEDLLINGIIIPANTFIYARASLAGDRLGLAIESIRFGDYLFPVQLNAYDYDGLKGIHIPGSIEREMAKQDAGSSIRSLDFNTVSLDESIQDKAISNGTNFLKDMFSRKVRAVKVT
ncbi:hypothetical protein LCGC14_1947770, partial [marine sediment metagenome]